MPRETYLQRIAREAVYRKEAISQGKLKPLAEEKFDEVYKRVRYGKGAYTDIAKEFDVSISEIYLAVRTGDMKRGIFISQNPRYKELN